MSLSKSMNTNSSGKGIGTFTVLSRVVWLNNTRTFRPARRIKRERTSLSILSALAESAPVYSSTDKIFVAWTYGNRVWDWMARRLSTLIFTKGNSVLGNPRTSPLVHARRLQSPSDSIQPLSSSISTMVVPCSMYYASLQVSTKVNVSRV